RDLRHRRGHGRQLLSFRRHDEGLYPARVRRCPGGPALGVEAWRRSGDDTQPPRHLLDMFRLAKSTRQPQGDYASCSGCGLCLLVCPVWRRQRDIGLTPLGRAKALQHGAVAADIAESIQSCTLCAACEPVCPEEIALVAMTLDLRRELVQPALAQSLRTRMKTQAARPLAPPLSSRAVLLPGPALRERPATLERAAPLLGGTDKI